MTRYPYHRYLRYQVLNGDSVVEIRRHMDDLGYFPPAEDDIREIQSSISGRLIDKELRERHGVTFFDDPSPSLESVFWLVETAPARSCVERLLLDRVDTKKISIVIGIKFSQKIGQKAIELFRDGFWDTGTLTPVDFSKYFKLQNKNKPEIPPERVSLSGRPHYSAWESGLIPDDSELPVDEMIHEVMVDSFMQFKRLQSSGNPDDHKSAMAYAGLFLKTAPAKRKEKFASEGKGNKIPELRMIVEYPYSKVPTISELHREYADETSGTGPDIDSMGLDKK